ncbi:hypothetical protein ACH5RR_026055 [Cinchona calisaya]|uniref:Uncharacterized protein n=1 Tax=Cinchona calisaya TaxID=153742 RepID=A0ABD2Z2K1_9GENT
MKDKCAQQMTTFKEAKKVNYGFKIVKLEHKLIEKAQRCSDLQALHAIELTMLKEESKKVAKDLLSKQSLLEAALSKLEKTRTELSQSRSPRCLDNLQLGIFSKDPDPIVVEKKEKEEAQLTP